MLDWRNLFGELPLILASSSPRRTELLQQIGLEHKVMVSNMKEDTNEKVPHQVVVDLARKKAQVFSKTLKEGVIIGADTVVAINDEILGKPKDEQEAFYMLSRLNGNVHSVLTGVHIILVDGNLLKEKSFYVESKVKMFRMTEEEIWNYIQTKEPMDKAGAYGIQGKAGIYIEEIKGDYYNIVGLPIGVLWKELKNIGKEYKK